MKAILLLLCTAPLASCGYNHIQQLDEPVNAYKSQIQVQLQRRADLVPNLVQTVKGYAQHEEEISTAVAEARAKLGGALQTGDLKQMAAANQGLTGALGRLIAISEAYPQLKANENFRMLQDQLEGTENRITTARNRFIKATRDYNILVRQFPTNLTAMMFGYKEKPTFTVENEKAISRPPTVEFAPPPKMPVSAD